MLDAIDEDLNAGLITKEEADVLHEQVFLEFAQQVGRGAAKVWNDMLDRAGVTDPAERQRLSQAKLYLNGELLTGDRSPVGRGTMDTRTGAIRELPNGEDPTEHEIKLTNRQARRLTQLSPVDRVEWAARQGLAKDALRERKRARKAQRAARKANR